MSGPGDRVSGDPHDLVAGYALDALDDEERARFTAHLPSCPQCRTEVGYLSEAAADLGSTTAVTPPPQVERRLMAELFGDPAENPKVVRSLPARRRWLWPAAAAATFILGAGLVAATGVLHSSDSGQQVVAESQLILDVAGAPDAHFMPLELPTGAAKIVVSDQMNMGAVMASDLPMPPAGQEYHVWTVMNDGTMMSAATFTPDSHGSASVMLHTGVRDASAFMLTVEDSGVDRPAGSPLAEVQV